jgi:hypothetical protein
MPLGREHDPVVPSTPGCPGVRIVHDSGMGILRTALRQYLQKHPHVATFAEPAKRKWRRSYGG